MKTKKLLLKGLIVTSLTLSILMIIKPLKAQLSISSTGTNYTVDFDGTVSGVSNGAYAGSGYTPTPAAGQLDSDAWAIDGLADGTLSFGGTQTGNDFGRGTSSGGEVSGGLYAFEVATSNFAWGVQPAGSDFTPGNVTLRIQNNTGSAITQIDLSYNIYVYNDQSRGNSFNFSYSSDNSTYTNVSSLDFTSPEAADPSPSWVSTSRSTSITSINIADGSYFYLRWTGNDVSGSGSRDEFGLDDIVISAPGAGSVDNPTAFSAEVVSTSQIDLSWTRNANLDDVMLAWNSTNTFGTPSGTYSVGNTITGGGTVLYVGSDTTYNHTGLDPDTYYYYRVWSVDGSTNYSSGVSDNAQTQADEPSNYPTGFSATPGGLAVFLSWSDATGTQLPDAYLVMASDTDTLTSPTDGVAVADDGDLIDGYAVLNVNYGIEETSFYGLDVETQYFFKVFPYTGTGTEINYKTDGTPPEATTSTRVIINVNSFESGDFGTWDTINVAGSTNEDNNWLVDSFDGGALGSSSYALINGYLDATCNDWLISPAINLDNYSNPAMSFFTRWRYGNMDTELTLKYSSDYSGDPETATWAPLTFDKPSTEQTWVGSGFVDLSSLSGTVYIAFQYLAESGNQRRWKVDEIAITGSGVANPTNLIVNGSSTSQIDLLWSLNGDNDSILIAYNSTNTFGTPSGSYETGDPVGGGGTVLYKGIGTATNHTGLSKATTYYYKAWSFTASYNYSGGLVEEGTTFDDEPTNHPTGLSATATGATRITVTWTDSDADNYLIKASDVSYNDITAPTDGVEEPGSELVKNVASGNETVQFTSLNPTTQYYFKIFPYNGTGAAVNYKTDGTIPQATATTEDIPTNLYITEVVDPSDVGNAKYVELYNSGTEAFDLSEIPINLVRQANGGSTNSILLDGSIPAQSFYIIANNETDFVNSYGVAADKYSGSVSGNGNDGYFLYYDGDDETGYLMDSYGVVDQDGEGQDWEYTDGHSVRKRDITSSNSSFTMDEWVFIGAGTDQMTPGAHAETVTWQGTSSTDWNERGTNWNGTNGYVPDASYDVTVPSATNSPEVNDPSACNDLNIQTSGSVTIKNGGSLKVVKQ